MLAAALFSHGPARAAEEFKRAHEAAALGSGSGAFDIALEGLKAGRPDRELFLYAVELLPENSPDRARVLASIAGARLEADKEDYAWYIGICKAMRITGRSAEALSNCKKAMELDPTVYPVYRELGLTYAAAGSPQKAAETLEQGVEISSSSYQARYYLAEVLEKRGDPGRAAASYAEGLALMKLDTDPDAGRYRALLKAGLKRTSRAKAKPRAKSPEPAAAGNKRQAPPPGNKQLAAACLARFREESLKDNLGTALAESDACLKLAPADPQLAAERAPLLVRLGRYEDGVKEYERAASLYGGRKSASAFCRVKAAETWIKLGKQEKAVAQYRLALKDEPREMNALKGLAAAQEARSDFSGAARTYDEILRLEPGNERARVRKEELKSGALSGAEILQELKLRRLAEEKKTEPLPEDIKLFKAVKAAEIAGAVDYLKQKVPGGARGLIEERATPEGTKLMLNADGYKAYVFHASRDAVKFYEGQGIGLREVFTLRTLAGAPVFDPGGKLTPEGEESWRSSSPGNKNWLLVYEPVPASPEAEKADKEIEEAKKGGYAEIYEPEYLWLLQKTQCPEDVLQDAPIKLLILNDGTRRRYMMCWFETGTCMNGVNDKLPSYIESYRGGNTDVNEAKTSTAFFGTGAVKKAHFCEKGRIWAGEIPK